METNSQIKAIKTIYYGLDFYKKCNFIFAFLFNPNKVLYIVRYVVIVLLLFSCSKQVAYG